MRRTIALLSLSASLPCVILGASFGAVTLINERSSLSGAVEGRARYSAALIGRELSSDKRATAMMAQSPAFDGGFDRERFARLAGRLVAMQPEWRRIRVSDATGATRLEVPQMPSGASPSSVIDLESFRWAVAHRLPDIGRVVSGSRGTFAFPVRAPVVRDGRVGYVVTTVIPAATLRELLFDQRLPPEWYAEVVDGNGNVVASAGAAARTIGETAASAALTARLSGRPALYSVPRSNGSSDIATWVPVPATNWTMHVGAPSRLFLGPWYRAVVLMALAGVFSLLISFALFRLLIRDLRQTRQREAIEVQSQRMEALGRLTGGIAHDFNNLLTPILGGLDLLRRRIGDDAKSLRYVEAGIQSAERAKTLVGRLLAYSRRQALVPKAVDVNRLVVDLLELLRTSIGPSVSIETKLGDGLRAAFVDPAQLELAILNLAINARDAMPDGGSVTVETGERTPDADLGLSSEPHVCVSVADTGSGMDAQTLRNATEPFFTTKPVERGTGLGLSMVQGFSAQSGGALQLASSLGAGTKATIWLPALGEANMGGASPDGGHAGQDEARGSALTILLVDDEADVRSVAAEGLRSMGHAVTEASSVREALAILSRATFEVLITDYLMPGGSGADLIRAVRKEKPGMRLMVLSGYINALGDVPAQIPRLAKPFSINDLGVAVRSVMERRPYDPQSP